MHLHEIDTQSRHLSTELMDSIVIVFIIVLLTGENIIHGLFHSIIWDIINFFFLLTCQNNYALECLLTLFT